ncbi:TPA: hypothetical protein DF272_02320 [Candidatus Falkowbacteria bacterium]|nr:hypothetical protein [Candidatus Falkowbacteria bacterium]
MDNQTIIKKDNGTAYIQDPLSKIVIGICYEIFNSIGPGVREKYYEDAVEHKFKKRGVIYQRQLKVDIKLDGEKIGFRRLDFLVEKRLVVELKIGNYLSQAEFNQVKEYLKINNLKLGLIILFTTHGVRVRRVVNLS